MHRVFVYGTLQRGELNHHLIEKCAEYSGQAKFIGLGITVEKRPLIIATKYNVPFLLDTTSCGEHVTGELYEVDDVALLQLDKLEAHPLIYTRTLIDIDLIKDGISEFEEKERTQAWCYLLPHSLEAYLKRKPYLTRYSTAIAAELNKPYQAKSDRDTDDATLLELIKQDI